jgi:UDP-2,3-diacylglucosamine pyrophosphatase LpxH
MAKLTKVGFLPDTHSPFHDAKAFATAVNALRGWGVEQLYILGDFVDCLTISEYERSPARINTLDREIEVANELLDELDSIKTLQKKVFIEGNHEFRLHRLLMRPPASALFGLVAMRDLLKLNDRGWSWVPYRTHTMVGKAVVTHDVGPAGKSALFQTMSAVQHPIIIGHTHRAGLHFEGTALGERHVAASFGWLGDAEQVDYMHQVKARRDWQLGLGVGYLEPTGAIHLQVIPILTKGTYRCVLEGVVYSPAGPHVAVPEPLNGKKKAS